MHPARLWASQRAWCRGWALRSSCSVLSRLCASFPRMCERTSQNRSAGHWLLALSLAWLWTLLASQPPTPTGLGQATQPGVGFSWRPGEPGTAPPHSRARRSPRPGKMWILGFLAPFLFFTQENLPSSAIPAQRSCGQTCGSLSLQARPCSAGREAVGRRLKFNLLA